MFWDIFISSLILIIVILVIGRVVAGLLSADEE